MKTLKTFPLLTLPKAQPAQLDSLCIERDIFIMKEILLSQQSKKNKGKYIALVDDEDYETVNQFRWHAYKNRNTIYARRNINILNRKQTGQSLHQFIMGENFIDHIDRDGLNCQRLNMRKCTPQQNSFNSSGVKNSASIFKGVIWNKTVKKWQAQIGMNKKCIYIGIYTDEIDAAIAYDKKAVELYGEFARLNILIQDEKI